MSGTRALLAWYEGRRSAYPWRRTTDPYAVLVSEVMLQQTQASRVAPAFERFLASFATVDALAAASCADVVRAWGGLGYNRRAVSLWRAAAAIVEHHAGVLPRDPFVLRSLPGVGPYTAAAVASIVYGVPVVAVDTNVARVVGRAAGGRDDLPRAQVHRLAAEWLDRSRPGDWNQAIMDVGRSFCRPRPACDGCPLRWGCAFRRNGARPAGARRREPAFAGSNRQVRGAVVSVLRARASASLQALAEATGHPRERIALAVTGLVADGVASAGPAAALGSPRGRVRLAR